MPFVHITWLPKSCRTATVRKEIADAVMRVMVAHPEADIAKENLVVRFSEAVDGFSLPKGHSMNPELQEPQKPEAEAYLKDRK
jgi:phenylpyruvate tautomerase PptA (4-oxalocrotonate tautomerase family)